MWVIWLHVFLKHRGGLGGPAVIASVTFLILKNCVFVINKIKVILT